MTTTLWGVHVLVMIYFCLLKNRAFLTARALLVSVLGFFLSLSALAGEQQITTSVATDRLAQDRQIVVGVNYATTAVGGSTGLGLRLHFDSSQLALAPSNITNLLTTDAIAQQIQNDTDDLDNDARTDQFYLAAWASLEGNWLASAEAPSTLYEAVFNVTDAFDNSTLNYSIASSDVAYQVIHTSAMVSERALAGRAYHWNTHALMPEVNVRLSDASDGGASNGSATAGTNTQGHYQVSSGNDGLKQLTATRAIGAAESGGAISSADALAALKIAVGINPNTNQPDSQGALPVSPYQYIAADVNGDGRVTSADALEILKMAVNLESASPRRWVFVAEDYDFWDETDNGGNGDFTTSRNSVTWDSDGVILNAQDNSTQNVVGVLMGDVNGSWEAPSHAAKLEESYFAELAEQTEALAQWGINGTPSDEQAVDGDATTNPPAVTAPAATCSPTARDNMLDCVLPISGVDQQFFVYVPSSYSEGQNTALPVLISLHGGADYAEANIEYTGFSAVAETEEFLAIYPQSPVDGDKGTTGWDAESVEAVGERDDIAFIEAIIDWAGVTYNADLKRVYSVGFSNGGRMSYHLACNVSAKITAVSAVVGSMGVTTYAGCNPTHPTAIMHIKGQDDYSPYAIESSFARSPEDVTDYWKSYNNCSTTEAITIADTNGDGVGGIREVYSDCDDGVEVELITLENFGHSWPSTESTSSKGSGGSDLEASSFIWNFLKRQQRE